MNENKQPGVKWLNFLYTLLIIYCVLAPLTIIANIISLVNYNLYYSFVNGPGKFLMVLCIITSIARFTVNICALVNKEKSKGYGFLLAAVWLISICSILDGFVKSSSVGLFLILLEPVFIVPTVIYITKRRDLYLPSGIDHYSECSENNIRYKCGKCGYEGQYMGNCPRCNSWIKYYY